MISRLQGTLWQVLPDSVIVNVGGVGFQVRVPVNVLSRLDEVGKPAELSTHLHVRENELVLYGFLTDEDRRLFELLLGVNGVGPRVALAVLGFLTPEALQQAVSQDEPSILTRVPGIGAKTAKAIVFHLKDRLGPLTSVPGVVVTDTDADLIDALTALGFSIVEAQTALQNLPREELPFEERLRLALGYLAKPERRSGE